MESTDSDATDAVQRAMVKALESMTQVNHYLDRRFDAAQHRMWQMQQQLMSCQAACATVTAQNAHLRFVVQAYEESVLADRADQEELANGNSNSDTPSECSSHDHLTLPDDIVSMQA